MRLNLQITVIQRHELSPVSKVVRNWVKKLSLDSNFWFLDGGALLYSQ